MFTSNLIPQPITSDYINHTDFSFNQSDISLAGRRNRDERQQQRTKDNEDERRECGKKDERQGRKTEARESDATA